MHGVDSEDLNGEGKHEMRAFPSGFYWKVYKKRRDCAWPGAYGRQIQTS